MGNRPYIPGATAGADGGPGGGGGPAVAGTFAEVELYADAAHRTADIAANNALVAFTLDRAPKRGTRGYIRIISNEGTAAAPLYMYHECPSWSWSEWLDLEAKTTAETNGENGINRSVKRGQNVTSTSSAVANFQIFRVDDETIRIKCTHWNEFDLARLFIIEEHPTGSKGAKGDAGSGVAPGWIEPKDEYVADDLGKFLIEHGVIKKVVLEAHAGHSRVVEFQTLANSAYAVDADDNRVVTGVAGEFLGFFANVSAIPALSIDDGSWAAFTGAGDFEIQDPTAFYASEHWNSYNPFRGSGNRPWSTITLADATTQDHVAFTDPDTGLISDWRIVNITEHAERFTTAVGEAFFIQDEQKIKMVIAYTPHEAGEVQYVSEPYVAPGPFPDQSADVAIDTANQAVDTTFQVPGVPWFFFNLGAGATALHTNGEWHRVRTAQLMGLDDAAADDAPTRLNALKFNDIAAGVDVDVWLLKDADRNLYVAMSDAVNDPTPFSIAV